MRTVGSHRNRVDATTDEKCCPILAFNLVLRFTHREGKYTAARAVIADLVCKRC
jgi:hypothetical protein